MPKPKEIASRAKLILLLSHHTHVFIDLFYFSLWQLVDRTNSNRMQCRLTAISSMLIVNSGLNELWTRLWGFDKNEQCQST
jgi:hypothetical protein